MIDFDSLTKRQQEVLGQIALGGMPGVSRRTLESLEKRGLIVGYEDEIRGKGNSPIDRIPLKVRCYYMPIPVHAAWCQWCADNCEEEPAA